MNRKLIVGAFVVVGIGLFVSWLMNPTNLSIESSVSVDKSFDALTLTTDDTNAVDTRSSSGAEQPPPRLLGETILEGYANTNVPPENDLLLVSQLMNNSLLLLKSAGNRPLSANEDWADLWRGVNAAQERFLSDDHIAFNAKGQLIDRWQTPLFFHAEGGGRWSVRSAGPDREMWTDDDNHRNSDGSHLRGTNLNTRSLWRASQ